MNLDYVLTEQYRGRPLEELLTAPTNALAGIDAAAAAALEAQFKIASVAALGKNVLFRFAQAMVVMGDVKNDAAHSDWHDRALRDVLDEPPTVVKYISQDQAEALKSSLGISTIRAMGTNIVFRRAQALLALAEGS